MVDEKARVVLKKSEFSTLTYYLDEYSARQMTIEAFVAVLLELLNTPDKVSDIHHFLTGNNLMMATHKLCASHAFTISDVISLY